MAGRKHTTSSAAAEAAALSSRGGAAASRLFCVTQLAALLLAFLVAPGRAKKDESVKESDCFLWLCSERRLCASRAPTPAAPMRVHRSRRPHNSPKQKYRHNQNKNKTKNKNKASAGRGEARLRNPLPCSCTDVDARDAFADLATPGAGGVNYTCWQQYTFNKCGDDFMKAAIEEIPEGYCQISW